MTDPDPNIGPVDPSEAQAETASAILTHAAVRLHTDGQYSRQQAVDEVRRFKNAIDRL